MRCQQYGVLEKVNSAQFFKEAPPTPTIRDETTNLSKQISLLRGALQEPGRVEARGASLAG